MDLAKVHPLGQEPPAQEPPAQQEQDADVVAALAALAELNAQTERQEEDAEMLRAETKDALAELGLGGSLARSVTLNGHQLQQVKKYARWKRMIMEHKWFGTSKAFVFGTLFLMLDMATDWTVFLTVWAAGALNPWWWKWWLGAGLALPHLACMAGIAMYVQLAGLDRSRVGGKLSAACGDDCGVFIFTALEWLLILLATLCYLGLAAFGLTWGTDLAVAVLLSTCCCGCWIVPWASSAYKGVYDPPIATDKRTARLLWIVLLLCLPMMPFFLDLAMLPIAAARACGHDFPPHAEAFLVSYSTVRALSEALLEALPQVTFQAWAFVDCQQRDCGFGEQVVEDTSLPPSSRPVPSLLP